MPPKLRRISKPMSDMELSDASSVESAGICSLRMKRDRRIVINLIFDRQHNDIGRSMNTAYERSVEAREAHICLRSCLSAEYPL